MIIRIFLSWSAWILGGTARPFYRVPDHCRFIPQEPCIRRHIPWHRSRSHRHNVQWPFCSVKTINICNCSTERKSASSRRKMLLTDRCQTGLKNCRWHLARLVTLHSPWRWLPAVRCSCHRLTGNFPSGSLHFRACYRKPHSLQRVGDDTVPVSRHYWKSAIWLLFSTLLRVTIFHWASQKQAPNDKHCRFIPTPIYLGSTLNPSNPVVIISIP